MEKQMEKQIKNQSEKKLDQGMDDLGTNQGIVSEFIGFLRHNRKWWLAPLILTLLIVGGLLLIAGKNAAIAPFIYTLF